MNQLSSSLFISLIIALLAICCHTNGVTITIIDGVADEAAAADESINPYEAGCLQEVLNGDKAGYYEEKYRSMRSSTSSVYQLYERLKTTKRVCNSEDTNQTNCAPRTDLNREYAEVRIAAQDWVSATFLCWLIQIFLSEFLQVPVTIETGAPNKSLSFYDTDNGLDFGVAANFDALRNAHNVGGDCTSTSTGNCAHIIPETWTKDHIQELVDLNDEGIIEPSRSFGMMGSQGWYVTKWTLDQNNWTTVNGLQGDRNRHKLAEMFRRPTTWGDYCALLSKDNCTTPDSTAARPPRDTTEKESFFVAGLYTGHFRATDQNNCTLNPHSCTGHFADFPCHWGSYVRAQSYHQQIAVEPNEYTYGQLIEIWEAANATKSHLLGIWWEPSNLVERFSDEMVSLHNHLPRPTQDCIENRIDTSQRCNPYATAEQLVGEPMGACREGAFTLEMVVANALYDQVYGQGALEAQTSPAYDAIQGFRISELQVQEILVDWESSPRVSTCHWVADNLDFLEQFIPRGFPRVVQDLHVSSNSLYYVATTFGAFSIAYVLMAIGLTLKRREDPVIKYAQVEFLLMLLLGFLMVSIGSLLVAIEPNEARCIAAPWLITLGYTLQMAPTIIKVAAISHLVGAARKMRRVYLDKKKLFGCVAGLCLLMVGFCTVWTVVDPPASTIDMHVSQNVSDQGEFIVYETHYCTSKSNTWKYMSALSHFLLLFVAAVMTYQMRSFHTKVNESRTLSIKVYSSCVFLVLRVLVYVLEESWPAHVALSEVQSLIFSIDTIASITIYFLPKFMANNKDDMWHSKRNNLDSDTSTSNERRVRFRGETGSGSPSATSDMSEGKTSSDFVSKGSARSSRNANSRNIGPTAGAPLITTTEEMASNQGIDDRHRIKAIPHEREGQPLDFNPIVDNGTRDEDIHRDEETPSTPSTPARCGEISEEGLLNFNAAKIARGEDKFGDETWPTGMRCRRCRRICPYCEDCYSEP